MATAANDDRQRALRVAACAAAVLRATTRQAAQVFGPGVLAAAGDQP
jgi:hypothetical protein